MSYCTLFTHKISNSGMRNVCGKCSISQSPTKLVQYDASTVPRKLGTTNANLYMNWFMFNIKWFWTDSAVVRRNNFNVLRLIPITFRPTAITQASLSHVKAINVFSHKNEDTKSWPPQSWRCCKFCTANDILLTWARVQITGPVNNYGVIDYEDTIKSYCLSKKLISKYV